MALITVVNDDGPNAFEANFYAPAIISRSMYIARQN